MKILAASCVFVAAVVALAGQIQDNLNPGRNDRIRRRGLQAFYPADKFDLSALPAYVPGPNVSGTIRIWGSNYIADSRIAHFWEEDFRRYHPGVKFEYHLPDSLTALGGLYTGAADLGSGPKLTWNDNSAFLHTFSYEPLEIRIATGSFNVTGWNPAFGVFVHQDNPLTKINFSQLDGVFGAEREGGWVGFAWHDEFARGPEKNIRTWGQLGLTGDWADKPIHVHWLNLRYHMSETISNRLLKGSDKWNEKAHLYANRNLPEGDTYIASRRCMDEVAKDPYAITISTIAWMTPPTKALDVAEQDAGPYVPMTIETCQNGAYPLADQSYLYLNRKPGTPVDPKLKEFLRYVLSREGQTAIMRDGKFLPLTAGVAQEELKKLE